MLAPGGGWLGNGHSLFGGAYGMTGLRPELAEGLGTFFLVLVGGATILSAAGGFAVALAFGFVIAALIYALGHVCGAHFNPAITVGFAATGHFPWRRVPGYVAAQLLGAVAASFLLRALLGNVLAVTTQVRPGLGIPAAVVVETLASFLLGFVILAVATDKRVAQAAGGLAIGLTVAVNAFWAGPLTGSSTNPARSLGPALAAGAFTDLALYLVVPFLGACAGMAAYEFLRPGRTPRVADPLGALGTFDLGKDKP